ncbi:putative inositol 5-phosphatase [Aspergillus candidus]|uniref:DNase I-like protein n=1 Tax=Aspergillus candidus TaxID=41067 RepID=A0A2I2EXP4_ASPCN|nr:DNase I-like protein [Aspergillus candidus]PLB33140.1 DNase I-like protein [Aspergillus candidus]
MNPLSLYILTFNCARNLVDVNRFANHFFDARPRNDPSPPDLIVLSVQELAPIAYAFLGGSYLDPYFSSLKDVVNQAVAQRWDIDYVNLVTDNSGMTGLMVFARSDVAERVSSVDTARIGFGFQEMGNKGAVGARLAYATEETPDGSIDLTFVAAHLAPMESAVEQRNHDWRSVVERLVFERPVATARGSLEPDDPETSGLLHGSTSNGGDDRRGIFFSNSYLFIAGDLNYRTSNVSPGQEDLARFPRLNADPADPRHYSQLLTDDQLTREMRQSRSFHGLTEAPIGFPPTYKYTLAAQKAAAQAPVGPAGATYDSLPLFPTSDHRAVALSVAVPIVASRPVDATHVSAPFPIDPDWQRKRDMARQREIVPLGCWVHGSCFDRCGTLSEALQRIRSRMETAVP